MIFGGFFCCFSIFVVVFELCTRPRSMRRAASVARLPLHRRADGAVGIQGKGLRKVIFREGNKSGLRQT